MQKFVPRQCHPDLREGSGYATFKSRRSEPLHVALAWMYVMPTGTGSGGPPRLFTAADAIWDLLASPRACKCTKVAPTDG